MIPYLIFSLLGLSVFGIENCGEGVAQLIQECPQIDQLSKLAADLLARSIVSEKEFPLGCCEVIAEMNEAECFCEENLVQQFSKVAGDEFLASLLFQSSQVQPAGCSVKVMAALDSDTCSPFGNQLFTEDLLAYQSECTEDNLISDVLFESKGLQFLKEAIDLLDLHSQIDLFPSVTLFAPMDEAFESWSQTEGITPEDLFADTELLVTILARHIVVNATILPQNIIDPEPFKTLQGTNLFITLNSNKKAKQIRSKSDLLLVQGFETKALSRACNGMIYQVDAILWPEDKTAGQIIPALNFEPDSVAAPVHVVPAVGDLRGLEKLLADIPEGEDDEIYDFGVGVSFAKSMDSVSVGMSRAVQGDDGCKINVYQLTTQFLPLFSEYLAYAEAQGLQDILEKNTGITVTIPINTAFAGKSDQEIAQNWNPLNHIIMQELTLTQLAQLTQPLVSLGGAVTVSTRPSGKVVVGGAEIVQSDVVGCNGRLQVVGQLIMNDEVTPVSPQYPLNPMDMSNTQVELNNTSSDHEQPEVEEEEESDVPLVEELQQDVEAGAMTNAKTANVPDVLNGSTLEIAGPNPEPNAAVPPFIRTPRPSSVSTPLPTQQLQSNVDQALALANSTVAAPPQQYIRPVRPSVPAPSIIMPSPQVFNQPYAGLSPVPLQPPVVFQYQSPVAPSQYDSSITAPLEYEYPQEGGGNDISLVNTFVPSSLPPSPSPLLSSTGPYEVEPKPGLLTPITQVIQDSSSSPQLDVRQFIQAGSPIISVPDIDSSPSLDSTQAVINVPDSPVEPPCACSADGYSGGVDTGKMGCQEFVKGWPKFCYVVNPYGCFLSKPSQRFVGARWRNCTVIEDDVGGGEETQFDVLSQVADSTTETPPPAPPAPTGSNSGPCSCSPTGTSGSVQTGRPGCVEHVPGYSPFCYVLDPLNCFVSRESTRYPRAGWRYCAVPNQDEQPQKSDNVIRVTILPVFDPVTGTSKFGMFLTSNDDESQNQISS